MKKVLIISDNPFLCSAFADIVKEDIYSSFKFDYSCSEFSNPEDFAHGEIKQLNLKIKDQVRLIIKDYFLVFSIHCKQFFPELLVKSVKCINIHPGYNPINRGWYPQVFAIVEDLPIGATIHEIDTELDNGNIIDRIFVQKTNIDTSLTLYNKILTAEIDLLRKNLINILNQTYETITPESDGNLFLKKDFNKLCKIDLDEKMSARQFIDKLRALSHGNYSNAFYDDEVTGEKIYLKLDLEKKND